MIYSLVNVNAPTNILISGLNLLNAYLHFCTYRYYITSHLPLYPPSNLVYTSTHSHTYPPTYIPTHLSTYPPTYLPTYPPNHLTYPPTYPPTHLSSHPHTNPPCLSPTSITTPLPNYPPMYLPSHWPIYMHTFTSMCAHNYPIMELSLLSIFSIEVEFCIQKSYWQHETTNERQEGTEWLYCK